MDPPLSPETAVSANVILNSHELLSPTKTPDVPRPICHLINDKRTYYGRVTGIAAKRVVEGKTHE